MLIKKAADLRESDVTPQTLYLRRREFMQAAGGALVGATVAACGGSVTEPVHAQNPNAQKLAVAR